MQCTLFKVSMGHSEFLSGALSLQSPVESSYDTCILLLIWHMYPPPHMTHVSSSSYDTCILLWLYSRSGGPASLAHPRVSWFQTECSQHTWPLPDHMPPGPPAASKNPVKRNKGIPNGFQNVSLKLRNPFSALSSLRGTRNRFAETTNLK